MTDIARDMVMRFGMEESIGPVSYERPASPFLAGMPNPESWRERRYSDETAHAIDGAVQHIVRQAFERTVSILNAHREVLDRGARLLLEKETLDERELQKLRDELRPVPEHAIAPYAQALG